MEQDEIGKPGEPVTRESAERKYRESRKRLILVGSLFLAAAALRLAIGVSYAWIYLGVMGAMWLVGAPLALHFMRRRLDREVREAELGR
jgi:hypothetical protein